MGNFYAVIAYFNKIKKMGNFYAIIADFNKIKNNFIFTTDINRVFYTTFKERLFQFLFYKCLNTKDTVLQGL